MPTTFIYDMENDSALSRPINEALHRYFSDDTYTLLELNKQQIKPCMGCFCCWTKTFGKCAIKGDILEKILPAYVQSDYFVIVTNSHYGSYSTTTKRVFDRMIPVSLPFFRTYKNEMHHPPRYKHMAKQILLAYDENMTPAEKETFRKLAKANNTNMSNPVASTVYFCTTPADIETTMEQIKKQISAGR